MAFERVLRSLRNSSVRTCSALRRSSSAAKRAVSSV
jgi:hypothetical protein